MDDGKAHFETLVVDDEPTEGVVGTSEALCALAPVGLLAELTHRCPLQCSYCSNPLERERVNKQLTTEEWCSAMTQAGEMGILQVHLSGGEPTARKDLEQIVEMGDEREGAWPSETALEAAAASVTRADVLARAACVRADDIGLMIFSSGTTSRPKACMLTHRSLCQTGAAMAERFRFTSQDKVWDPLPLFHMSTILPLAGCRATGGGRPRRPRRARRGRAR